MEWVFFFIKNKNKIFLEINYNGEKRRKGKKKYKKKPLKM
jgi:hypothetical protein